MFRRLFGQERVPDCPLAANAKASQKTEQAERRRAGCARSQCRSERVNANGPHEYSLAAEDVGGVTENDSADAGGTQCCAEENGLLSVGELQLTADRNQQEREKNQVV